MADLVSISKCHIYLDFNFTVKLNGGRHVVGVLRGFDPFMNLVMDEAVEQVKGGENNPIGMIVSSLVILLLFW